MPYKKPGSGIFARRTSDGIFGDKGQTESIFGKGKKKKEVVKRAKKKGIDDERGSKSIKRRGKSNKAL